MDEDVDPFLEYEQKNINYEEDKEDVGGEDNGSKDEGRQSDFRSSPIFSTPNVRFGSNQSRRRIRKPTSDLPTNNISSSLVGQRLEHMSGPPSSPENLFISQHLESNPVILTPANQVVQEAFSPCRSESEEDIFVSLPSTSGSQEVITSAINELISCPQPADVSWTSSMATPLASNVTYSNLNTEERKVLLPSEDCGVAVKPRALFSPDANDTTDCHSLNISSDAEYLQNLQGEKLLKTPKFINKIGSKAYSESPLAAKESMSPVLKFSKNLNEVSGGSPILSGSSEFKRSSNHRLIREDENLFDNAEETDQISCQGGSNQDCSAESTPNIGNKRKIVKDVSETPTFYKGEVNNVESFLQDVSVTALEEVCKAQELKNTLQSSVTPEKEKQIDSKRKRLLFSSNLSASNSVTAIFKTPESKARKNETPALLNGEDNIIPDDSFMEHLAAMNTSIFSEEPVTTTKVQSIRSSISQKTKFLYSVHQQIEENSEKSLTKAEPKKLMREMLSSVLALESCSSPSNPKIRTVKSTGDLVVFSQIIGEVEEAPGQDKIHLSNHLASMKFEDHSAKQEEPQTATSSLLPTGFETANGNQITLSQEAVEKGLSVLKEAIEDFDVPLVDRLQFVPPAVSYSEKKVNNPVPSYNGGKNDTNISSNMNDDQVEEEVKELLKLVKDGEDFHPWHEIEQPVIGKDERESEIKSNEADPQCCTYSVTPTDEVAHNIVSPFAGFSTANGKNILVSEDKLAQAEKLLRDTDHDSIIQMSKSGGKGSEPQKMKFEGKRRSVEDEDCYDTTAKKRVCLETVTSALEMGSEQHSKISSIITNEKSVSIPKGKASDMSINISEEALNIVNNIFGNKPVSTSTKPNYSSDTNKVSGGFLTAGGKAVLISQRALKEAENLFADIPAEETSEWKIKNIGSSKNNSKNSTSTPCHKDEITFESRKKFTISEKPVARVKNVINDISLQATDLDDDPSLNIKEFSNIEEGKDQLEGLKMEADNSKNKNLKVGFSTASGKTVNISEDSFNKVRNLFDDIPAKIVITPEPSDLMEDKQITEQTKSFEIKRSLKSLTESQRRSVLEIPTPGNVWSMEEELKSTLSSMFSTASGKTVNVSEQALKKVKDIFKKSDLEVDFSPSIRDSHNEIPLSMENLTGGGESSINASNVQGFLTASGKNVSVSNDALNKVKGLFNEEFLPSEDFDFQHTSSSFLQMATSLKSASSEVKACHKDYVEPALKTAAFSTAGGRTVHVSKEALIKAKNIFDDLPDKCLNKFKTNTADLNDSKSTCKIQTQNCEDYKAGFSTAGGKSLNISKEALSKAQVLFDDMPFIIEETVSIDNKNGRPVNHPNPARKSTASIEMIGFSTAAGNAVQVSKEAIEKARNLLEELPTETSDELTCSALLKPKYPHDIPNEIPCFTTAAGKSVCVSKDALKKAEYLFEELPLETPDKEENVCSVSSRKLRPTSSVSDDSGVGLSCESTNKSLRSNTSLIRTSNVLDISLFPRRNKENQNVRTHQVQGVTDMPKSSLTQEITASTAAFLADGEFFDDTESLDDTAIKTSPSMVSDRFNSLKPILSSALDNKKGQPIEPTSPILVRSDSMATRRRARKGRLSLSSNPSLKSISPSQRGKYDLSENRFKSRSSLPPKMTSPLTNSAINKQTSVINSLNRKCDQDLKHTVKDEDNLKEYSKLPPSRKLFDHGGMSSAELDTPNAKSIGIAPLSESEGTPTSSCNNDKISQSIKSLHQPSLVKRTLTKNQSCPSSGFKTPYKTTNNNELKRSSSSPAQNQPEAKKRKPCTNLYVSHIHLPSFKEIITERRNLRPEVAEMRRRASEEQKHLVENFAELKGELLKPCAGTWFASRSGENSSVKAIKLRNMGQPTNFFPHELIEIGLTKAAVSISADSSEEFRFSAWDYYSEDMCKENVAGLPVGDGALLVLDFQGTAGVEEFERAFLASPGVDPALVPSSWVKNHYRWIVWKLAALERMFPYQFGKRCLSPHMVMLQLKYRYDREVDNCQRPALRRILEQDDSAAKRIVLCVAGIIGGKDSNGSQVELELTDGWYSVLATIDADMQCRVRKGIIKVGTKLITHGAELLNCSEGCSPLQAHPDIRLKLCSNSTRRARWYTKLGFQDNPGPMKISLASVLSSGGPISCFSAYVARVYPIVYMEKTQERTVVRSQRAESKEVTKSERKRQQLAEVVYSQVQSELQVEQSKKKLKTLKFSFKNLPSITSGEELCDILESSADPLSVQCMLTEEQKGIVADFQRHRHEELRSEMEARVRLRLSGKSDQERQVTAILKVRLLDCDSNKSCSALLSVWRPSEDISAVFKEGQKITIFGAVANGIRCGDLQLSSSRSTRYHVGNLSETRSDLQRTVFPFDSLTQNMKLPCFGELDIVGIVIRITPAPQTPGNTSHFQTAYVSDSQQNIIGITFWEGIKVFAVEDLIKPRAFIAASNLQWRVGSSNRAIPSVYVSEFSFFTTNPKPAYLQTALQSLQRSLPSDLKIFCRACEDKLDNILSSPAGCAKMPNAVQPSSPLAKKEKPASDPALHPQVPPDISSEVVVKAQQRLSLNSDLESPSNALPSPAVEKRIAKLEKYGDPPPISPILICQPRRSLKKAFKAPRRTDSPSTLDIQKKN